MTILLLLLCLLSPALLAAATLLKLGADAVHRVPLSARKITGRVALASTLVLAFGYVVGVFMSLGPMFPDDYCMASGGGPFRGMEESPLTLTSTVQCGEQVHHLIPPWTPFALVALLGVAMVASELYFSSVYREATRALKAQ